VSDLKRKSKKSGSRGSLLFIGPRPPPISGYANIVNKLAGLIGSQDVDIKYVSSNPQVKLMPFHRQLHLVLLLPMIFVMLPLHKMVYLNANGGLGQIFDCFVVLFSRAFRKKVYLHHNSFSYIAAYEPMAALLFWLAGAKATHVVNCISMSQGLTARYSSVSRVIQAPNAGILAYERKPQKAVLNEIEPTRACVKLKIGFMGYFDQNKGVDTFSEIIAASVNNGVDVSAIAIGPSLDEALMASLKSRYGHIVDYAAPIYDEEGKAGFFNSLDMLLFPTKYKTEADPLTIHEALKLGIPVIATDLGCISEVLQDIEFCASYSQVEYIAKAIKCIDTMANTPMGRRAEIRESVKCSYNQYCDAQRLKVDLLLREIMDQHN
jgi:glycosyltransferase involved in cell wall biosynthesis